MIRALAGVALAVTAGGCTAKHDPVAAAIAAGTAAWQGHWRARIEIAAGTAWTPQGRVALSIRGTRAELRDGDTVHAVELAVTPCALELYEPLRDHTRPLVATLQYVLIDGAMTAGRGAVGRRVGKTTTVCLADEGGTFVVRADGTCTVTRATLTAPGRCTWLGDVLRVATDSSSVELVPHGAYLASAAFIASMGEPAVIQGE